jgi:2-phosphosulfolactate phosphatase
MPRLLVHLLPELTTRKELSGGTVAVIDVLRATTTISAALAADCQAVIPCMEVEEARRIAARYPRAEVVLGGERQGLPIEGFDLGNSPGKYTAGAVGGKTVVFTTTNGTRAMQAARQAGRILIAAFTNLSAVCRRLTELASAPDAPDVHLLCAGTGGHVTREDALLAGAISARLILAAPEAWQVDDQARLAADAWLCISGSVTGACGAIDPAALAYELRQSHGGRNLIAIQLDHDIQAAAAVDRHQRVGELNSADWRIVAGPAKAK